MECPLGHGPLTPESHAGLSVQACAQCGGEWLERDALAVVEASAVSDRSVLAGMVEYQPHASDRHCPQCGKEMYEFDYRANPLELDACPDGHGYWLDGGEEARVRDLIIQRARDLNRSASAQESFGAFMSSMRAKLGGKNSRR
jgi:Zn-finger nucleic acid-binding protein